MTERVTRNNHKREFVVLLVQQIVPKNCLIEVDIANETGMNIVHKGEPFRILEEPNNIGR